MYAETALQLPLVSQQSAERGIEIKRRRARLGIASLSEFARASGIPRKTLAAVEDGTAQERSYIKTEKWLDDFEHETGDPTDEELASHGLVKFSVGGDFGVSVIVEGPVTNMPEMEAAVGRLLDRLRSEGGGASGAVGE